MNFQNLIIILINSNMATEIGVGMCEETARELERLRREVLMAKQELQDIFENYFVCYVRNISKWRHDLM